LSEFFSSLNRKNKFGSFASLVFERDDEFIAHWERVDEGKFERLRTNCEVLLLQSHLWGLVSGEQVGLLAKNDKRLRSRRMN
jgi:hypothetical protein